MSITIKSEENLEKMRRAGKILSDLLKLIEKEVYVGQTTARLNEMAIDYLQSKNVTPSFLGYHGFPYAICASTNHEVVHGYPTNTPLKDGDIVGIDAGVCYEGYHADAARTFGVGIVSQETQRLIDVTRQSFFEGIEGIKAGCKLGNISARIQRYVEMNGYTVVRELVGHGIGESLHEDPAVPNYGRYNAGVVLRKGMALAIEPMVNMGTKNIKQEANGWTISTLDGKLSAHYENTVIICENNVEILTI